MLRRAFVFGVLLLEPGLHCLFAATAPDGEFTLEGQGYLPSAIVFSPDLRWLAAWKIPNRVEVWDVGAGTKSAEWTAGPATQREGIPRSQARPLAFLNDGKSLLLATPTNVAIHEMRSGRIESTLDAAGLNVERVSISEDSSRAVGFSRRPAPEFVFWSLPDGRRLTNLPTQRAPWEAQSPGFSALTSRKAPASMSPAGGLADWSVSPGAEFFAIGYPMAVDLWDLKEGRWLSRVSALENPKLRSAAGQARAARTSICFLSATNVAAVFNEATLALLNFGNKLTLGPLLDVNGGTKGSLEIRALAVSADGRRLAVGGMRMASRPAIFAGRGEVVFDVPQEAEIQVWDAVQAKLLKRIEGPPGDKFGQVAMDKAGQRVAGVTTGVRYNSAMLGPAQQSAELKRTDSLRVLVWDVR